VLRSENLELRDEFAVASGREVGFDALFECVQA
jgi:hypothetical protein